MQEFHEAQGWQFGKFTKDKDGFYTSMWEVAFGLLVPGQNQKFHRDMRLRPEDWEWQKGSLENVLEQDKRVIATGKTSTGINLFRNADDRWQRGTVTKIRSATGGIEMWQASQVMKGWPEKLDLQASRLNLPDGTYLTARELQVIRMLVLGYPRKVMAELLFVSVKTIEKYQAKLRDQLRPNSCQCHSLIHLLQEIGLARFVTIQPDWFATGLCYTPTN